MAKLQDGDKELERYQEEHLAPLRAVDILLGLARESLEILVDNATCMDHGEWDNYNRSILLLMEAERLCDNATRVAEGRTLPEDLEAIISRRVKRLRKIREEIDLDDMMRQINLDRARGDYTMNVHSFSYRE